MAAPTGVTTMTTDVAAARRGRWRRTLRRFAAAAVLAAGGQRVCLAQHGRPATSGALVPPVIARGTAGPRVPGGGLAQLCNNCQSRTPPPPHTHHHHHHHSHTGLWLRLVMLQRRKRPSTLPLPPTPSFAEFCSPSLPPTPRGQVPGSGSLLLQRKRPEDEPPAVLLQHLTLSLSPAADVASLSTARVAAQRTQELAPPLLPPHCQRMDDLTWLQLVEGTKVCVGGRAGVRAGGRAADVWAGGRAGGRTCVHECMLA